MATPYSMMTPGGWASLGAPTQAESQQLAQYLQMQKMYADLQTKQDELALKQAEFEEKRGVDRAEVGIKGAAEHREEMAAAVKQRSDSYARYQDYIKGEQAQTNNNVKNLIAMAHQAGGVPNGAATKNNLALYSGYLWAWDKLAGNSPGKPISAQQVRTLRIDKDFSRNVPENIREVVRQGLLQRATDPEKASAFYSQLKQGFQLAQAQTAGISASAGASPANASREYLKAATEYMLSHQKHYDPREAQRWYEMENGSTGQSGSAKEKPKSETPTDSIGYFVGGDGKLVIGPTRTASEETKQDIDRFNTSKWGSSKSLHFDPSDPEAMAKARQYFDAFRNYQNPPKGESGVKPISLSEGTTEYYPDTHQVVNKVPADSRIDMSGYEQAKITIKPGAYKRPGAPAAPPARAPRRDPDVTPSLAPGLSEGIPPEGLY